MPAPSSDTPALSPDSRSLGHVNLMVDTFIANASIEEHVLQSILSRISS
ncbi:hypothetical protein EWM64_g3646 [Hericium alpestre]|uniref:Uncharacterized protein n=1 Tax=Hericium alpestre TaxID=135208 RepID=A0A4Z0A3V0_9AGAM|nr:hypothetical protein EWM64_g3646 [Hericium alpestre]